MYVPNYMPEPIEVPGNVTTEKYAIRLVFIRRVIWLHLVSMVLIACAMSLPMPHRGIESTGLTLVGFLVILDIVRIRTRGGREEPWLSCAFFAPVIVLVAALLRELDAHQFPVWAFFVGPPCVALYSGVCGRDFSFVGGFFLSLIASSLIVAMAALYFHLSGPVQPTRSWRTPCISFIGFTTLRPCLPAGASAKSRRLSSTCIAMFLTSSDIFPE